MTDVKFAAPHAYGTEPQFGPLRSHGRFPYRPITDADTHAWPNGAGLAVYLGFNLEHFAFGEGLGANLGPVSPQPDVLNYSWREYGNRVGAWRCLELFDQMRMPAGVLLNTSLYDHCPQLLDACLARGDELIGHGHTNARRQSEYDETGERALLVHCRERIAAHAGTAPAGWLSPWISETLVTPDLLAETGYRYTLNWCHDDRPVRMDTRGGPLWSIPYPQELNDIPMIIGRQLDGRDFADMIIDQFDEMLAQAYRGQAGGGRVQPLVMGIALHPYLVGQPYRLRHLRRALAHIAAARDEGKVWFTTPGAICAHMESVVPHMPTAGLAPQVAPTAMPAAIATASR
jgi:peptidoglycan/xylan/chitin deacetylase (PgdA/CDA1 family)